MRDRDRDRDRDRELRGEGARANFSSFYEWFASFKEAEDRVCELLDEGVQAWVTVWDKDWQEWR